MRPFRGIVVDERAAGRRVDAYLARRFPSWSRTALARYIEDASIASEDRTLKPSSRLKLGERLRVYVPGLAPDDAPPPLPPVLYEDDRVIAFDKPPGLLVHSAGQKFTWGLIGIARQARPGQTLDLVHRLDRETSGVVLVTKDAEANAALKKALMRHGRATARGRPDSHAVRKVYQAIVRGVPEWDATEVDAPIGHPPQSAIRIRRGVVPGGRLARTRVRVLRRICANDGADLALVEVEPLTGRTHQIRVHLEHLGFPVLGDKMYGHGDEVFLHLLDHGPDAVVRAAVRFPRQALHARMIAVPHPNGGDLRVVAPLAADMAAVVDGSSPSWPGDSG